MSSNSKTTKPTHKLKKEFIYSESERYPAGTLVYLYPRNQRGTDGFGGNAFFLDKNGKFAVNRTKMIAAFSLHFFSPQKDWFEKV